MIPQLGDTLYMYSITHRDAGLASTTLAGLLDGLRRFPPGRYPVHEAIQERLWGPAKKRICGVAIHHGDGRVELVPDGPAGAARCPVA